MLQTIVALQNTFMDSIAVLLVSFSLYQPLKFYVLTFIPWCDNVLQVIGAYFEKLGSKSFAVYSIAVTDAENKTRFVKRRHAVI